MGCGRTPGRHVHNTHLHVGEFHGSELMMANFMRTYQDPSFLEAHRTMAQVTPATIVEWLKRRALIQPATSSTGLANEAGGRTNKIVERSFLKC
jgi:hypothetical protein